MTILLLFLVIALGLLARKLVMEKSWVYGKAVNKNNKMGGLLMFNKWFKLALVSFLGIIISGFALGLLNNTSLSPSASMHGNMGGTVPMGNAQLMSSDSMTNQQMNMMMNRMNQMMNHMDNMMNNMSMMSSGMNMGGGMTGMPSSGGMGGMGMMGMPMNMPMGSSGGMGMMSMPGGSMGGMSGGGMSGGMSGGTSGAGMSGGASSGGGGGSMGGMSMM